MVFKVVQEISIFPYIDLKFYLFKVFEFLFYYYKSISLILLRNPKINLFNGAPRSPHIRLVMHWHVNSENKKALEFYEKFGNFGKTYVEQAFLTISPWESLCSNSQVFVFDEVWTSMTMFVFCYMAQICVQQTHSYTRESNKE